MLPPSGHAWRVAQRAQQVRLERTRAGADTAGSPELGELRHLEALVAAGIDAAEGRQGQGHVHGEAGITAPAAPPHPAGRRAAPRPRPTRGAWAVLGAGA